MGATDTAAQKDQHGGIRRAKTCGCLLCKAALMPDGWRP